MAKKSRSVLTKSAHSARGVYSDINLAMRNMEKTSGFGEWFAENISRPAWGGLGVAAANAKYLVDGVGNVPRAFGAKNNWWGDDFQNSSWKDYNKAGWEVGKGSAEVMAGGLAKGLTFGMSDTVNDAADDAAVQSERNLNGDASADRAKKLLDMRRYYRDYGPEEFQRVFGSADPELLKAFSEGDTGLSEGVSFAQKGGQIAGSLATIPLGNVAIGAAGKGIGALAGAVRGGETVAKIVNGVTQASGLAHTARSVGRVMKPLGNIAKHIWNWATKYRLPIAGTTGVVKGVSDGVSSGSPTQGIESGLNWASMPYLMAGGPWGAFVSMNAMGDMVGEWGRTGNVMDSMVAGSQSAAQNSLFGKAFNVAPGTTMATTLGVPAVGVVKKYNTLQDSLQRADDNNAVLKERDAILSGENVGSYEGYVSRDDMLAILKVVPKEKENAALAEWYRRLHRSGQYDELSLNDLYALRELVRAREMTKEEWREIGGAIIQRARQAKQ